MHDINIACHNQKQAPACIPVYTFRILKLYIYILCQSNTPCTGLG